MTDRPLGVGMKPARRAKLREALTQLRDNVALQGDHQAAALVNQWLMDLAVGQAAEDLFLREVIDGLQRPAQVTSLGIVDD